MRLLWLSVIGAAFTPASALAQGVIVAPHAIVIDHRTRSTEITLYNPGREPAEVTISGFFGYPVTTEAGDFELATPDPATDGLPSAADWIDAYPRRVVIGPLERQTVRLLGRPPAGLADGEYWSRLMISVRGGRLPVAVTDSTPGIAVGLELEVRTILPIQYRKGRMRTGVRVQGLRTTTEGDSLVVRARLDRDGNAAFVGTARLRLYDSTSTVVSSVAIPLSVYRSIDPRMMLPIADLPPASYRLELELRAERTDLTPDQIVGAEPARASITVPIR